MIHALALAAALLVPVDEERFSLAYRPVVGEVTKSNVSVAYKTGGPALEVKYELSSEVLKIEKDGSYLAKVGIASTRIKQEGKPEVRNEASAEWEATYNARGEQLPFEDAEEAEDDTPLADLMRLAVGYEPKVPVKLGETWTPQMDERLNLYPLKYTLVGAAPYEGRTELTLEGRGPGRDGANVKTNVWLDSVTFVRRKAIVRITETPTETGNDGEIVITIDSKTLNRK